MDLGDATDFLKAGVYPTESFLLAKFTFVFDELITFGVPFG